MDHGKPLITRDAAAMAIAFQVIAAKENAQGRHYTPKSPARTV
jgi:hypothetical protein